MLYFPETKSSVGVVQLNIRLFEEKPVYTHDAFGLTCIKQNNSNHSTNK